MMPYPSDRLLTMTYWFVGKAIYQYFPTYTRFGKTVHRDQLEQVITLYSVSFSGKIFKDKPGSMKLINQLDMTPGVFARFALYPQAARKVQFLPVS